MYPRSLSTLVLLTFLNKKGSFPTACLLTLPFFRVRRKLPATAASETTPIPAKTPPCANALTASVGVVIPCSA